MQNQRQNGRPDAAVRMAGLFLVLFCVAAVLIPVKTLFTGNGFFADYIHFTESPVQLSIGHQDFARFHSVFALIRTECAQIVLPQIARQTARARPRTRQQYHTVFFFLPARQIAD